MKRFGEEALSFDPISCELQGKVDQDRFSGMVNLLVISIFLPQTQTSHFTFVWFLKPVFTFGSQFHVISF